jgi:branched-chain amino acid transport system ATP-binding protein
MAASGAAARTGRRGWTWARMMFRVEALTKRYAGVLAVNQLSYTVAAGEIVGLIGPNGSGKSTSIDCVSGFTRPDEGRWWLEDQELTGRRPEQIYKIGLTRSFQTVRAYDELTLEANLLTAAQASDGVGWAGSLIRSRACRAAEAKSRDRAHRLLEMIGLAAYADAPSAVLSYGQRKLLSIAASMMAKPKLVILDEPVAGVNPTMVRRIEAAIHELSKEGTTLLVVEHNVDFIMAICDRVIVMEAGLKIADGSPDLIHNDEHVLAAYLGKKAASDV